MKCNRGLYYGNTLIGDNFTWYGVHRCNNCELWHLKTPFEFYLFLKSRGGLGVRGGDGVATVITVDGHCQGMTYPKGDQIWWFLPPFLKIIYIFYYIPTPSDDPGEPLYNWTWPLFSFFHIYSTSSITYQKWLNY